LVDVTDETSFFCCAAPETPAEHSPGAVHSVSLREPMAVTPPWRGRLHRLHAIYIFSIVEETEGGAMSADRNIMRRWFGELWTRGRVEIIDELVAPDCVIHGLMDEHGVPMKGPEPFKDFYRGLRAQFGKLRIDVEETLVDRGRIAARCVVRGTDAKTGKPVQFGGVAIVRMRRGRIVEGWNHFDFHHMAQQISAGRASLPSRPRKSAAKPKTTPRTTPKAKTGTRRRAA